MHSRPTLTDFLYNTSPTHTNNPSTGPTKCPFSFLLTHLDTFYFYSHIKHLFESSEHGSTFSEVVVPLLFDAFLARAFGSGMQFVVGNRVGLDVGNGTLFLVEDGRRR